MPCGGVGGRVVGGRGGGIGGAVVGGRGGGAGVELGVHSMGLLEGEEVHVGGEHGHGVGLEKGAGANVSSFWHQ